MMVNPELLVASSIALNAAVTAFVTRGTVRAAINQALREVNRAHRRLDAMDAPPLTDSQPLQL